MRKTSVLLRLQKSYIIFILLLTICKAGFTQQTLINYNSVNQPLSKVLEELNREYELKFAFDQEVFSGIIVSFDLKNCSVDRFLGILETYNVKSNLVEKTWVLIYSPLAVDVVKPAASPPEPTKHIVSGYVKDAFSGEKLLYCNVIYDTNRGTMTNNLGYFSFEILQPSNDRVRLIISHLGYQKLDTIINFEKPLILSLKPAEILIQDIEVKEVEKNVLEATPQPDKIGFNPLKSANFPRVAEDDMANAMLIIPGITFLQNSMAGLSIRGSSPADNLVLLDGIPVLETSHLLGNMSVLNSKYIHQAFVSRGGYDAEFAGRVAGLIELNGKSGTNSGFFLDVSANMLNTNILANIPVTSKLSVTAAWRRSFIDQWQNYLYKRLVDVQSNQDTLYQSTYPTIKYQDFNGNINFHPSEKLEMNINVLYGTDYQNSEFALLNKDNLVRTEQASGKNRGFSFNLNWQMNKRWYQSLTASYSDLEHEIIDEVVSSEDLTQTKSSVVYPQILSTGFSPINNNDVASKTYESDNGNNNVEDYRLNWKTEFKTGILKNQAGIGWSSDSYQYGYFANRPDYLVPVDSITGKATQYLLDGFIQQHIQWAPLIRFRWGVHAFYDLETRKSFWEPRAGFELIPLDGMKFHYSFGLYHQFLNTAKRIDSEGHFSPLWYLPDKNGLGQVKGVQHIAGITFEKNGWMINAEGYLKQTEGKINLFAEPVNNGNGWFIKYYPRKTDEKSRGIDLFIQKKQARLTHFIGYSLSKAEEKTDLISGGDWIPSYNDRLHQLKLNEMFTWNNWSITGNWHFGTGLPIINLSGNALPEIERSESFSQLDFAVVRKFSARFFTADAGISLLNVLNRKNIVEVDYLRFSSDSGSLTVRSDVSALAFTPLVFINFKFY
jgi:hypothetical protein